MKTVTIFDFYKLLRDFVKYYEKTDYRCTRMQTFAVLTEFSSLNTSNLKKSKRDIDKPYFWSRVWESKGNSVSSISYEYPILIAHWDRTDLRDLFSSKMKNHYVLNLLIADKYFEACEEGNPCEGRTVSEIYIKTEKFILELVAYIKNCVYAEGIGWINRDIYNALGYNQIIDEQASRKFVKLLESVNAKSQSTPWYGGDDKLYGTLITMKLSDPTCLIQDYNVNVIDVERKPDLGCL